jgi:uncharacterized membrane protein YczE
MTGINRRGVSIRLARTLIEIVVLVVGVLLGGSIGVGTAVFALGIGPLVHVFLPVFELDPRLRPDPGRPCDQNPDVNGLSSDSARA